MHKLAPLVASAVCFVVLLSSSCNREPEKGLCKPSCQIKTPNLSVLDPTSICNYVRTETPKIQKEYCSNPTETELEQVEYCLRYAGSVEQTYVVAEEVASRINGRIVEQLGWLRQREKEVVLGEYLQSELYWEAVANLDSLQHDADPHDDFDVVVSIIEVFGRRYFEHELRKRRLLEMQVGVCYSDCFAVKLQTRTFAERFAAIETLRRDPRVFSAGCSTFTNLGERSRNKGQSASSGTAQRATGSNLGSLVQPKSRWGAR